MENYERRESEASEKNGRRRFLQGAAAAAGGLVLGMPLCAHAEGETADEGTAAAGTEQEKQLDMPEKVLEAVGGFEVIEHGDEKTIVARTGPAKIIACSAICTHKGGTVAYDHESGQLFCARHGARYEVTGKVVQGPAKRDLQSYQTRPILGLSPAAEDSQ